MKRIAGRCAALGGAGILALLVMAALAPLAGAAVLSNGSVIPADNPFTIGVNEGLPFDGNFINPFEGSTAAAQTQFELQTEVIVGQTSFGVVLISGESAIRAQDLIIGDSGTLAGQQRFGTGIVRITGFGSLFNNNPNILPAGVPPIEVFGSRRDREIGFDLYVGREGNGTLEISVGGRAEIQDAVVVGHIGGSTGTILVDGFDSYLGSGGYATNIVGSLEPHEMLIGRLGTGLMNITNGGQVVVFAPPTLTEDTIVAAVIGGNRFDQNDPPEAGGQGTVNVDGIGSKWVLAGTLQIGGYHDSRESFAVPFDLEGDNAVYASNVGRGTLNVSNGGVVSLISPNNDELTALEQLDLLIGRFGRINLSGGRIELLGGIIDGQNPEPLIDDVRVINDGVISGSGRIATGGFRNRVLGEVRVGPGQTLVIDASAEILTSDVNAEEPLVNYGLIQTLGMATSRAELEFERSPSATNTELVRQFHNYRLLDGVVPANGGRRSGLIHAAHATLRFRSGLVNQGDISFTAGDNIISGNVLNAAEIVDGTDVTGAGRILIAGTQTTVTFEDDLVNDGIIDLAPNGALMNVLGDFSNSGTLSIVLGGGISGSELSYFSVGGDAELGGTLQVSLFNSGANPIDPMPGDIFEFLSATGELSGIFTSLIMPNLGPDQAMFPVYDYDAGTVSLRVASLIGIMGADFNGDGVVDAADLDIWRGNLGITMGATPAQGDADGDGDVDGDDFLLWQMQLGPVPGIGSGSVVTSPVPEPSGLALAIVAALLASSLRRRAI